MKNDKNDRASRYIAPIVFSIKGHTVEVKVGYWSLKDPDKKNPTATIFVFLPAQGGELHPNFQSDIKFFGEKLLPTWGMSTYEEKYRMNWVEISSNSWKKLREKVLLYIMEEINVLVQTIDPIIPRK